jgi:hypothetical protein
VTAQNTSRYYLIALILCIASIFKVEFVHAEERRDQFLAKLISPPGDRLRISNGLQVSLMSWVSRNLEGANSQFSDNDLAFKILFAMRNMYLNADSHMAAGTDLFQVVVQNPEASLWGHCGDSVDFLLKVFRLFEIDSRKISLWNWPGFGHEAIEIYSSKFKKYFFYDPLYGVLYVSSTGEPASLNDILEDISANKFNYSNWRSQPLRIYGGENVTLQVANDSIYEEYNSINYGWAIARNYFFVVALRKQDTTDQAIELENEEVARGRWILYDNTGASYLSTDQSEYFISQIEQQHSIANGGRYYISKYRLKTSP